MWFVYSLLSAFIYSFKNIFEKKYISKIDKYILAFGVRVFALPFFIIPLLINPDHIIPLNELPQEFWIPTIWVSLISTPIEMLLFYEALKDEEVTYLVPLLSLAPILTACLSIFFFNTFPSILGFCGMIVIVIGIYLLNTVKAKKGLLEPFKHIVNNRSARLILLMMLFYSLGGIADTIAIKASNTPFYSFMNYLLLSTSLFLICLLKGRRSFRALLINFKAFLLLGTIIAGYTILRFLAFETGSVAYVQAIVSISTLLTIIWGIIFLKEKNIKIKLLVGILITIGLILIKVFG